MFFEESFELSKLREAIMGKNGNNLDDLARMDGKMRMIFNNLLTCRRI